MLINGLFNAHSILREDGKITAAVAIAAGHAIFEGHFPTQPVTPGVLQLQLVKELIAEVIDRNLMLSTIGRCKFLAVWDPRNHPEIEVDINYTEENGELRASATGAKDETVFFKFSAVYR
ncbi:MAG: 3-hydroxyacyl-ACP dehydratase [Bacteroidota bacterium]